MANGVDSWLKKMANGNASQNHPVEDATRLVTTSVKLTKKVQDGFETVRANRDEGSRGVRSIFNSQLGAKELNTINVVGKVARVAGVLGAAYKLPAQTALAVEDIRASLQNHSWQDWDTTTQATALAARSAVTVARGTISTVLDERFLHGGYRAAKQVLLDGGMGKAEAHRLGLGAAKLTFERKDVGAELADYARGKGTPISHLLDGADARVAKKAAELLKTAGDATSAASLKTAGTRFARFAERWVPGLNFSLAGLDTVNALATWADPEASTGRKVVSTITAAGSIAAAAADDTFLGIAGATVAMVAGLGQAFVFKHKRLSVKVKDPEAKKQDDAKQPDDASSAAGT